MSCTSSASILPRHVDPRKFAQQSVNISGSFEVAKLNRLCELLANNQGLVHAELIFGVDDQGKRHMTGTVTADVEVTCQRCLEAAPLHLEVALNLAMVWNDDDAGQLSKAWDPWVLGEGQTDLYSVLEEELILSLPIVAYHEEQCLPHALYQSGELAPEEVVAETTESNPFQALESLKQSLANKSEK